MSIRRAFGVLAAAALTLTIAAAPAPNDPAEPGLERVSAESLGLDVHLTTDWRAEQLSTGEVRVIFGPGTSDQPVAADAVAIAASSETVVDDSLEATEATAAAAAVTAASWSCTNEAPPAVEKPSSLLKSYVGASCSNRPGTMQIEYWFQRSSWSGWRDYNGHNKTSTTTLQGLGANVYAACVTGGGTYDYRVRSRLIVDTGYLGSADAYGVGTGRFDCGTGIS